MAFNTIPELLDELRAGRMIVVLDDEDRENEGDLIMAASCVQASDINFMARHARGLICLALSQSRCQQLGLKPMVSDNKTPYGTAFTVSIEAAEGVTTGISAFDRAHTIQTAVRTEARPSDLKQPGHIFPLMARPGGVLTRAGHTEAACDFAALAGFEPAGVLVEIMSEDGSMARRPELEAFAAQHGLKIGTIADLIRYRLETEKTVERLHEAPVQTAHGEFRLVVYRDLIGQELHSALVLGDLRAPGPVLTRVHVKNYWSDVLGVERSDFGMPLRQAMARIAAEGRGVLIVLSERVDARSTLDRLLPGQASATSAAPEWRTNGLGAQILHDLGVHELKVLGTPRRYLGLSGFGLSVVGQTSA